MVCFATVPGLANESDLFLAKKLLVIYLRFDFFFRLVGEEQATVAIDLLGYHMDVFMLLTFLVTPQSHLNHFVLSDYESN